MKKVIIRIGNIYSSSSPISIKLLIEYSVPFYYHRYLQIIQKCVISFWIESACHRSQLSVDVAGRCEIFATLKG